MRTTCHSMTPATSPTPIRYTARHIASGVTAGLSIEPYYDSMIAKLIVHGRTRGDAIKIMQRALKEFRIDGVKTTISLHQKILSDSYFRTGNIDTQFIKKRIATYEAQKENGKNYLA